MRHERRRHVRRFAREAAQHREALERAGRRTLVWLADGAALVTAAGGAREPFHRWFPYRQGFAPELVRRFLRETRRPAGPVLDPFSGAGTTVIECARQGVPALGVEAVPALALCAQAAFGPPPEPIAAPPDERFEALARRLRTPAQRAALILALRAASAAEGRARRGAPAPAALFAEARQRMIEDLARPPRLSGSLLVGDARALPFADASMGGVLTSPPYLGRYDYRAQHERLAWLYQRAGGPAMTAAAQLTGGGRRGRRARPGPGALRQAQGKLATVRSDPSLTLRAPVGGASATGPRDAGPLPALDEAVAELAARGERGRATAVAAYFDDLARVLAELARVLRPGAPCWLVIAGAYEGATYVPADLLAAEWARTAGWEVTALEAARRLRDVGRALGALSDVAPRESILHLRRARAAPGR